MATKRNGIKSKQVKILDGTFIVETPQDRHSNFNPQIVQKRPTLLYNVLAITVEGKKEVIGGYVAKKSAKFWLHVRTDLKNRGVQDVLISCIDNLKGCWEAI